MLTDPKTFTQQELQFLQSFLQQVNENEDTGTDSQEHILLKDFLVKVRAVIQGAVTTVTLTAPENEFFQSLVETWRESSGIYQWAGIYGTRHGEGDVGPIAAGVDTYYGTGLSGSAIAERSMQTGANVIDSILFKLRS